MMILKDSYLASLRVPSGNFAFLYAAWTAIRRWAPRRQ